jgi:hypothetical protein
MTVIDTHSLVLNDKTGVTDDERIGSIRPLPAPEQLVREVQNRLSPQPVSALSAS